MADQVSVIQKWISALPLMQQAVLLSAMRAPDGMAKHHPAKDLIKWYRRCIVLAAFEKMVLDRPWREGGGSYTGPSITVDPDVVMECDEEYGWERMRYVVDAFLVSRDEMSLHCYVHFMHAFEIIGYKHPVDVIRNFWFDVYTRMAAALHLNIETCSVMDRRLGDNEVDWRASADEAGCCSD